MSFDTDCISRQQAVEALMAHFIPQTYTGEQVEQAEKLAQKIMNKVPSVTPTVSEDCISRDYMLKLQRELHGWMPNDKNHELWQKIKDAPPVTPPRKVVAEIKVDTEELVKRIKEEYQIEQEHGRLIDADKLLQDLFIVDEEEWTTPEIRAILEHAPTIITPTERTGEWIYHMDEAGNVKTVSCGICGGWVDITIPEQTAEFDYCPYCGAKMNKGGDDNAEND